MKRTSLLAAVAVALVLVSWIGAEPTVQASPYPPYCETLMGQPCSPNGITSPCWWHAEGYPSSCFCFRGAWNCAVRL